MDYFNQSTRIHRKGEVLQKNVSDKKSFMASREKDDDIINLILDSTTLEILL